MSTTAAQPEPPPGPPIDQTGAAALPEPVLPAEALAPAEPPLPTGTMREVEAMADGLRRITYYRRGPAEDEERTDR